MRLTFCRFIASRSKPACCSACAFASTCSALAAKNWRFVAISLSSSFRRCSSSFFCRFFNWSFSATSVMHFSLCLCFCCSSNIFCLFCSSCLCCCSSRARSRTFASISAFSVSSSCFSTFLASCLSRFMSSSFSRCDSTIRSRSLSSARDISSSKPWQGGSAGSNILYFSTGTFSRARICRIRSRLRSISCSSSFFFRSNSTSRSLRMLSALFTLSFRISSSFSRAFPLSSLVSSTRSFFSPSSHNFSRSFIWRPSCNSSRWCSARICFRRMLDS
mmetsp:Transcript_56547/g.123629  ORF Transcript_56547/g.123629 Transcript_56547/m.123629 type:complete len:275 (-) Transcript_56547:607-1431(-)